MRTHILAFLLVCCVSVFAAEPEGEPDTAEITAVRTFAIPEKRDPPRYPRNALRSGTEGWVVARFTITEDGATDGIEVVQASIDGVFEKAAIKAVSGWTFKPATLDGVPVRQGNRQAPLTFQIKSDNPAAVTGKFQDLYKEATLAIKDGDLDIAEEIITQLDASQKRLLAEVCYLDVLKSVYWQKMGNDKAQLWHINRALVIADRVTKESVHVSLLRQAIAANAKVGKYAAALKNYDALVEVKPDLPADDPANNIVSGIEQLLQGNAAIVTDGKITRCGKCQPPRSSWRHDLNRNSFSVDEVVGQVSDVEVICERQSVTLAYDPETVWSIERDWGGCDVRVHGEAGTTFRLIEHPAAR